MTFLFNDESISKVWYQTTQETTISFNADLWGQLDAVYRANLVKEADQIRSKFADELAIWTVTVQFFLDFHIQKRAGNVFVT